jgi:hypothetical protein
MFGKLLYINRDSGDIQLKMGYRGVNRPISIVERQIIEMQRPYVRPGQPSLFNRPASKPTHGVRVGAMPLLVPLHRCFTCLEPM